MTTILYKNKNYIAQQVLQTLKKCYINKKRKIKYKYDKYNYINIRLTYIYSQILFFLISLFIFFWILKQFYLIRFIY
ncbi:UNVERIFIED_CONTAM: ORF D protein (apicoplast) [Hammondia hammondi]|eukprot:XP_008889615.1 ORF D protein (apicoplast) [Hammondia hammondi]